MEELEGAIYNLKKESAPGPDFFVDLNYLNPSCSASSM
jgi:hypothetical protein